MFDRRYICLLLTLVCMTPGYGQGPPPTPGGPGAGLKIVVVEGEGARNSIKSRIGVPILVEVQDAQGRPVSGAQVIFQLPAGGASGSFPGGSLVQRSATNARGQAATSGFAPNTQEGRFNVKVTASSGGLTATQVVAQANVASTAAARGHSRKTLWILLAAGAAGGAVAALKGGGSSTPAVVPDPSNIVLVPGTVTVGGPR